jgi:hypothetical protein
LQHRNPTYQCHSSLLVVCKEIWMEAAPYRYSATELDVWGIDTLQCLKYLIPATFLSKHQARFRLIYSAPNCRQPTPRFSSTQTTCRHSKSSEYTIHTIHSSTVYPSTRTQSTTGYERQSHHRSSTGGPDSRANQTPFFRIHHQAALRQGFEILQDSLQL